MLPAGTCSSSGQQTNSTQCAVCSRGSDVGCGSSRQLGWRARCRQRRPLSRNGHPGSSWGCGQLRLPAAVLRRPVGQIAAAQLHTIAGHSSRGSSDSNSGHNPLQQLDRLQAVFLRRTAVSEIADALVPCRASSSTVAQQPHSRAALLLCPCPRRPARPGDLSGCRPAQRAGGSSRGARSSISVICRAAPPPPV